MHFYIDYTITGMHLSWVVQKSKRSLEFAKIVDLVGISVVISFSIRSSCDKCIFLCAVHFWDTPSFVFRYSQLSYVELKCRM